MPGPAWPSASGFLSSTTSVVTIFVIEAIGTGERLPPSASGPSNPMALIALAP
jgi:hypothetical protein